MARKKTRTIELLANSNRVFFLIHGYTGGTTDFNQLPYRLHQQFNANVKVVNLLGHGTKIADLDNIYYEDFLRQMETELQKSLKKNHKIILGGISFGALLSLELASKYPVEAIFNVCPPYNLRFPFNIPGLKFLGLIKKHWPKVRDEEEKKKRRGTFSYDFIHINSIEIIRQSRKKLKNNLKKISCPILSLHSYHDPVGHHKSLKKIQDKVKSFIKQGEILDNKVHNIFFSPKEEESYDKVIDFITKHNLFEKKPDKITAIIPAFNEGKRIASVLQAVTKATLLDEIIVVDDGSTDDTESVVKQFTNIKYLKNVKNIGKAQSMERGVENTDADIIFFCDADLINLTPEIVDEIIKPVKHGKFSMFIGLRNNLMQKGVHLFAINSGERALRRNVWETLPPYFKYKYRVEAGLNYHVKQNFGGFGYQRFNYSQPVKEKKYGFIKGTILRWGMNLDVLYTYIRNIFERLFKRN